MSSIDYDDVIKEANKLLRTPAGGFAGWPQETKEYSTMADCEHRVEVVGGANAIGFNNTPTGMVPYANCPDCGEDIPVARIRELCIPRNQG